MKKLIVTGRSGDEVFVGDSIETEFNRIMTQGYGGKIPAVFIAEKTDGSLEKATGKDAQKFLNDPDIEEVTVIAPIAGGVEW